MLITRNLILEKLEACQKGELKAQDVYIWARKHYWPGETEFNDLEGDDSVAKQVLSCLNTFGVVVEDIPIHIRFLRTPKGGFKKGFENWKQSLL